MLDDNSRFGFVSMLTSFATSASRGYFEVSFVDGDVFEFFKHSNCYTDHRCVNSISSFGGGHTVPLMGSRFILEYIKCLVSNNIDRDKSVIIFNESRLKDHSDSLL